MGKKIGIAVSVIILVAALVVCLVPFKIAEQTLEPLSYEVIGTQNYTWKERGAYHAPRYMYNPYAEHETMVMPGGYEYKQMFGYNITLRNTDEVDGAFLIQLRDAEKLTSQSVYLKSGEEGTATFTASHTIQSLFEVIPEKKIVTRYKEVTLLDYLLHY